MYIVRNIKRFVAYMASTTSKSYVLGLQGLRLQGQKIIIDSFVYVDLQENQGSPPSRNNGITAASSNHLRQ
jgi:hypothetical protein